MSLPTGIGGNVFHAWRLPVASALVGLLSALAPAAAFQPPAIEVKIVSPANECIIHDAKLTAQGELVNGMPGDVDLVTLWLNSKLQPQKPTTAGNKWTFTGVQLADGLNVIRVSLPGASDWLLVNKIAAIVPRKSLKVRLVWGKDADKKLIEIANVIKRLAAAEEIPFVSSVQLRVALLLQDVYVGAGIPLELVPTPAPDVQPIEIVADKHFNGAYGETLPVDKLDYGDRGINPCHIYLGSFVSSMQADRRQWQPMRDTDPLETRIEDLAHVLAHTCAHELGHCLGLVGFHSGDPGAWMRGCNLGHNCPNFPQTLQRLYDKDFRERPTDQRYGQGFELMDGSSDVLPQVFTGRAFYMPPRPQDPMVRWGHINTLNCAYLRLLYH